MSVYYKYDLPYIVALYYIIIDVLIPTRYIICIVTYLNHICVYLHLGASFTKSNYVTMGGI